MYRLGFTMLELIFVIVILGVLAAVAIPKLNATRDDASIVQIVQGIKASTGEIMAYVVAKNVIDDNISVMSNVLAGFASRGIADVTNARQAVIKAGNSVDCVTINITNYGSDENLSLQYASSTDAICLGVQAKLSETNIQIKGRTVVH